MVGGGVKAAYRRAAQYGSGWTMGGGTPDETREGREALDAAWSKAGRSGRAKASVLAYYCLGSNAKETASEYVHAYYDPMGVEIANMIADSVAVDEDTVAAYAQAYEDAGADEVVFFPGSTRRGPGRGAGAGTAAALAGPAEAAAWNQPSREASSRTGSRPTWGSMRYLSGRCVVERAGREVHDHRVRGRPGVLVGVPDARRDAAAGPRVPSVEAPNARSART